MTTANNNLLALALDALKKVYPYLDDIEDEGPTNEGWKSDGLISAISKAKEAIEALEAAQSQPASDERTELIEAIDYLDDYIARIEGNDRGSCESINVIRAALLATDAKAGWEDKYPNNEKSWTIDTSAGRPILVLNGCSVIEAEDAEYVLSLIQKDSSPQPQAEAVRAPLTEEPDIEAAAKKLAACMDYPWECMPEQGRKAMRKHAIEVIEASRGIAQKEGE